MEFNYFDTSYSVALFDTQYTQMVKIQTIICKQNRSPYYSFHSLVL